MILYNHVWAVVDWYLVDVVVGVVVIVVLLFVIVVLDVATRWGCWLYMMSVYVVSEWKHAEELDLVVFADL